MTEICYVVTSWEGSKEEFSQDELPLAKQYARALVRRGERLVWLDRRITTDGWKTFTSERISHDGK